MNTDIGEAQVQRQLRLRMHYYMLAVGGACQAMQASAV